MLDTHVARVLFELLPGRSSVLGRRRRIIHLHAFRRRLFWGGRLVLFWETCHEQGIKAFPCVLRQVLTHRGAELLIKLMQGGVKQTVQALRSWWLNMEA